MTETTMEAMTLLYGLLAAIQEHDWASASPMCERLLDLHFPESHVAATDENHVAHMVQFAERQPTQMIIH